MIVITEIIWVLSLFYKLDRTTIAEYISLFLTTKYLVIKEKPLIQKAVELFKKANVDFIDCFVAATAGKRKALVCSYDRDFDKLPDTKRVEPEDLLKQFLA